MQFLGAGCGPSCRGSKKKGFIATSQLPLLLWLCTSLNSAATLEGWLCFFGLYFLTSTLDI